MFGRKYKYDYDAEDDGDENGLNAALPPPAPVAKSDYLIAFVLGVFMAAMSWFLSWKGLHPNAWSDAVTASGLRPPSALLPGIWRIASYGIYKLVGISAGNMILALGGKCALGLATFLAYLSFRGLLALLVRKLPVDGFWNHRLARLTAAMAALAFACADPIWTVCQSLSTSAFLLLLFLATMTQSIRFLHNGKVRCAYSSMFLVGVLISESPLGIAVLAAFWGVYGVLLSRGFLVQVDLTSLFVRQNSKWYLTFCAAFGVMFGVTANVLGFIHMDGLAANGWALGDIPLRYIIQYWHATTGAASLGGWIVTGGIAITPFVLVLALVHRATDVEYFLKYQVGLIFFVLAACAYSQLASLQPLWSWTWINTPVMVTSPLLLATFSFMAAVTLLCSLAVLGVDAYCRNNRRLAHQLDPDSPEELDGVGEMKSGTRTFVLVTVAVLLTAGLIPGRIQPRTLRMLSIMRDYVHEVVAEVGDATWLFTDGSYDCAIELEAVSRGKTLYCVSLLPSATSRTAYAVKKTLPDAEDRLSADVGGSNLLRTWERDKPERLEKCAFQLGFELWRRSGKAYPPVAGTLARTEGKFTPEELEAAVRRGYLLSEAVLALYADGGTTPLAGRQINDLFLFLQWRLARLARIRSEIFDAQDQTDRSLEEVRVADLLDDKNESLKRIIEGMTKLKELTMRQMTPREGLQFALVRADFALARRYAEPILDADPDDPNANFGMGMSYFMQEQWGRAEEFLTRCLKRNEKEPAIWNNIAVLQLRTGRLDEAKQNAEKALSLIPNSAEVKDTLSQIEKAIQVAATNKTDAVSAPVQEAK